MKTILIPFDFSGSGRVALHYALDLFRGEKIKCILLNVYDPAFRSTELELAALTNKFCADRQRKMWAEVDEVIAGRRSACALLEVRTEFGDWSRQVVNYTKEHPVDYVILGNPGANWFDKLVGNNVSAIVRKSSCPVLAVPDQARHIRPVKIAFVADPKLMAANEGLSTLRALAEEWRAEVAIWNLIHREEEMIDILQSRRFEALLGHRLGSFSFLNAHHSLEAIQSAITHDPVDLLVTPHYRGSFFDRFLLRNLAKELIMDVEVPLLTLPVRPTTPGRDSRSGYPYFTGREQRTDRQDFL